MSDLPSVDYTPVPAARAARVLIRARREECASARAVRGALVRAWWRGDQARRRVIASVLREALWAEIACLGSLLALLLWGRL